MATFLEQALEYSKGHDYDNNVEDPEVLERIFDDVGNRD